MTGRLGKGCVVKLNTGATILHYRVVSIERLTPHRESIVVERIRRDGTRIGFAKRRVFVVQDGVIMTGEYKTKRLALGGKG